MSTPVRCLLLEALRSGTAGQSRSTGCVVLDRVSSKWLDANPGQWCARTGFVPLSRFSPEKSGTEVFLATGRSHPARRRPSPTRRRAEADGAAAARLLDALDVIPSQRGNRLTPAELLDALRGLSGWGWVTSTKRLARLLIPLRIVRQQVREGDRRRWCYVLDAVRLAEVRREHEVDNETRAIAPTGPSAGLLPSRSGWHPVEP